METTNTAQPGGKTVRLTEEQFRRGLAALAKKAGSVAKLASQIGVTPQFLGKVIAGDRQAGPKILAHYGASMKRVIDVPFDGK